MPLSVGDKLGPYEILAQIGAGGMGEVWKARDTRLDRIVAIKFSKEQFSERFEREAKAVAALNHPNICQLYDVGPNYLVMEYVDGGPLKGPLPLDQCLIFAAQICDALDAAHRKGITHRDLKPGNILVARSGVKVVDFGLARIEHGSGDTTITIPGGISGTPAYMAPEQWDGKPGDARSDIYAFGCVLHEMLTGKLVAKDRQSVQPISIDKVLSLCLAQDPDDRWQSARDLRHSLALPAPAAAAAHRRGRWIAAASIAAVMTMIVALAGWKLFRSGSDEHVTRVEISPPEGREFLFGANSGGIALSPDGRTVAFVATTGGNIGLWVRPLDSSEARLLLGTEGAGHPFWSPDGKSIGFFSGTKLMRVDLVGGAPLPVCDIRSGSRGGTWTEDGRIIFGVAGSSLFQVLASGGVASRFTVLNREQGDLYHYFPQTLPEGKFLFFVRSAKPERRGIYVAPLDNPGAAKRILETDLRAFYARSRSGKGYILWVRDGTLLAQEFDVGSLKLTGEQRAIASPVGSVASQAIATVALSDGGALLYDAIGGLRQFIWYSRDGMPMSKVAEPAGYNSFRLSPDGHRIAVSLDRNASTNVWIIDERGVPTPFTNSPTINWYPAWSPDSKAIVWSGGATRDLLWKQLGSGSEEPLTTSAHIHNPNDWSAGDQRFILYYEFGEEDTQRDLWVLPIDASGRPQEPQAYLHTKANEWQGRFSPGLNPKWVAYTSDASGRSEVYIQSFPEPHSAIRISTGGGQFPTWGPLGKEVFYVAPDNNLMQVSLKASGDTVQPSTSAVLFSLPGSLDGGTPPYDVTPDGQRFLVLGPPGRVGHALKLILNWPALLKSDTPN